MSHFIKIGEASLVMIVSKDSTVPFRVDEDLVPWLSRFSWHVTDSRRPEALPPVLRKRDPRNGIGKTIRLPVVVKILRSLEKPEDRDDVVENFPLLVDLTKKTMVLKRPLNCQPLDCRFDNWCREPLAPMTDRSCLELKDEDDPLLLQGPEVLSPPPGLKAGLDRDLVEILTGQSANPQRELTSLSHATLSVDEILALARGSSPSHAA